MTEIILASASPRRAGLLRQLGIDFKVIPSNIEEKIDESFTPIEIVKNLSYEKAYYVANRLNNNCIVIGADTIVFKDKILGKPENWDDACDMLKLLQGEWHEVITGITLINPSNSKVIKDYEKTRVKFLPLSDKKIESYVNTGDCMDKAGSYGIQGLGALLVEKIEGCYFNVVGLPLVKFSKMLEEFNIYLI